MGKPLNDYGLSESILYDQGGSISVPGTVPFTANFGAASTHLLVGNFGDGRINAFDVTTGGFGGQLTDQHGNAIAIQGLWGLTFGNDGFAGANQCAVLYRGDSRRERRSLRKYQRGGLASLTGRVGWTVVAPQWLGRQASLGCLQGGRPHLYDPRG